MHHLVLNCHGMNSNFCLNGTLVAGPTVVSGTITAPTSFGLGAAGGWLDYLAHSMATLRIYSTALSAANASANCSASTVTGVSPNSGAVAGGTPVVITETGFTGGDAVQVRSRLRADHHSRQ